jgi:cytidylate kinase
MSDYARYLYSAVLSIARSGPTIFIGRGTHLIMPRKRVLAVRFISSKKHRVQRLAKILDVSEQTAEIKLNQIDKEQKRFFKQTFDLDCAPPYEFDMVINCDSIKEPEWAAEIVAKAYQEKFSSETGENNKRRNLAKMASV